MHMPRPKSSKAPPIQTFDESDMPERLGDPCNDRKMPDVLAPYSGFLNDKKLWLA